MISFGSSPYLVPISNSRILGVEPRRAVKSYSPEADQVKFGSNEKPASREKPACNPFAQLKNWAVHKFRRFVHFWQTCFNRLRKRYRDERQNVQVLESRQIITPDAYVVNFKRDVGSFFSPKRLLDSAHREMVTSEFRIDKTDQGWQISGKGKENQKPFRYLIEPMEDGEWLIKGRQEGEPKNWAFKFSKAASCYPNLYSCRGKKKEWFGRTQVIDFEVRGAGDFYMVDRNRIQGGDDETPIDVKRLQAAKTDTGWQNTFVDINDFVMDIQSRTKKPQEQLDGALLLSVLTIVEALHN